MTRMNNPIHPGRIVASAIEAEGWTVTHAAGCLGISRAFLSRIVHGHASITAATALRLETLGWSDAEHGCECRRRTTSHLSARVRSHDAAPGRSLANAWWA